MAWRSATFLTDAAHAEPLCDALLEAGALSATIEDADAGTPDEQPQFGEPGSVTTPGWQHSRVNALFDLTADIAGILATACAACGLPASPEFTVEDVIEQNWVQLTQSQFDPIRVSERLWIVPSWHEAPDPAAINLIPARANAEANAVSGLFADSSEPVAGEYDLVVANILSNPLRVLAPAICAHVRHGGRLALSGILEEQATEIIGIYAQWLPLDIADSREGWVCLAGVKP